MLINSGSSVALTFCMDTIHIVRNVPSNPGTIEVEVLRVQHLLLARSYSCNINLINYFFPLTFKNVSV